MQPRPTAETSGPSFPRRRVLILCMGSSFSAAEAAAQFMMVKWDRDSLVATGLAGGDRNFRTADPERLGEKLHHRFVRRTIGRSLRHTDFEFLAAVGAFAPVAYARLRRSRQNANCESALQSIATCGWPVPTWRPRRINNSKGSTANVTIIISLKSSR